MVLFGMRLILVNIFRNSLFYLEPHSNQIDFFTLIYFKVITIKTQITSYLNLVSNFSFTYLHFVKPGLTGVNGVLYTNS